MDDNVFLFFLFGMTAVVFFSLILISYLVFYFVFQDDESETPEGHLPSQMRLDLARYSQLDNYSRFMKMSDTEKITYLLSVSYCRFNKPNLVTTELSSTKVTTESLLIRDRGINSFHFLDYYDQIGSLVSKLENEQSENSEMTDGDVDETTALLENTELDFKNNKILKLLKAYNYKSCISKSIPFVVEDLVEINFKPTLINGISYSTLLNLPIPTVNRKNDVIYFETKLLEFSTLSTLVSIGLVTNPNYPNFQLPGYLPYSFAIDSTGNLRITKKQTYEPDSSAEDELNIVLPQLTEGDVIGLGYRSISGTIFLTHNGKLIHEVVKYFKFQMFPCIGFKNLATLDKKSNNGCKINVNLGQMGFVYIEANVKKLGFCENRNDGLIGAPPIYNKTNQTNEILLDKGDDIPPEYPTDEDTFFGPVVGSSTAEKLDNEAVTTTTEDKKVADLEEGNAADNSSASSRRTGTPASEPPSYQSEKSGDKSNMTDQEYESFVSPVEAQETGTTTEILPESYGATANGETTPLIPQQVLSGGKAKASVGSKQKLKKHKKKKKSKTVF